MQAHKWVSNSVKVFERIPTEKKVSEVHIASDGLPVAKTLGVTGCQGKTSSRLKQTLQRETFCLPNGISPKTLPSYLIPSGL